MGIIVKRADKNSAHELFERLSALDRLCIGAEGWSSDSFRAEAEKENGIVLYAEDDSSFEIAALLSGYYAAGEGDITSVATAPEYRRMGLAERLIRHFAELLPEDAENVFLEVRESNAAAAALYEKCGFTRLSLRKNFYTDPDENALVMMKTLLHGGKIC